MQCLRLTGAMNEASVYLSDVASCGDVVVADRLARPGPSLLTSHEHVAPAHLGGPLFGVFPLMS
jgi:hypothetical protein